MKHLHPLATHKLIKAFELSSDQVETYPDQVVRGILKSTLHKTLGEKDFLALSTYFEQVGHAKYLDVLCFDDMDRVQIQESEDPEFMMYESPEGYEIKKVPITDVEVYCVNEQKLLNDIADLLDIPTADRKCIQVASVDSVLWRLGTTRFENGFRSQIYVVRRIIHHLDAIQTHLLNDKKQALILSSSDNLPSYIQWPEGITVCALKDAIPCDFAKTTLDVQWLYNNVISSGSGGIVPADFPVTFDPARNVLSMKGKPDWHLKGKQALAIKYMVEQAQKDRWELTNKEIMASTRAKGQVGGSQKMSTLFSGSKGFNLYVMKAESGGWSLKLD